MFPFFYANSPRQGNANTFSSPFYLSSDMYNMPPMYNPNLYTIPAPSFSSFQLPQQQNTSKLGTDPSPTSPPLPVTFRGRRQVSQSGKRSVLCYRIPGTTTGYTFAHVRINKNYDVYVCTSCKKRRWNPIQVIGDEFLTDPCALGHVCTPMELGRDIANRIMYTELHRIREDPERYKGQTPYMVWDRLLSSTNSGDMYKELGIGDDGLRDHVLSEIHRGSYESRRKTLSRRINEVDGDPVSLTNIPPDLAQFHDGTMFLLGGPDENIHIYYSEKTL